MDGKHLKGFIKEAFMNNGELDRMFQPALRI